MKDRRRRREEEERKKRGRRKKERKEENQEMKEIQKKLTCVLALCSGELAEHDPAIQQHGSSLRDMINLPSIFLK